MSVCSRYQMFVAVLCGYIVEKQRQWQREELSEELVYVCLGGVDVCVCVCIFGGEKSERIWEEVRES